MGGRAYGHGFGELAVYRARAQRRRSLTNIVLGVLAVAAIAVIGAMLLLLARWLGLCAQTLGHHLHGSFQRLTGETGAAVDLLQVLLP